MDLENLAEQIKQCTRCALREGATQPVPGFGNVGAKYFLIGEAPGREEDEAGIPFVGKAGQRLNELIALAGIDINDCYFSNVCRCRPEGNATPRKAYIRACYQWLKQEIELVQPEYIITLGATPLGLFTATGVSQLHGTMFEAELPESI